MSIDLIQRLIDSKATDADELRVLLGVAQSTVYRYTNQTELRFGQLVHIFRFARDHRVREAVLAELLPASGWLVTRLPEDLDADGDGDVDLDDAMAKAIDAVGRAHQTLIALRDGELGTVNGDHAARLGELREAFAALAHDAQVGTAIADWLIRHHPRRRSARRTFIKRGVSRG